MKEKKLKVKPKEFDIELGTFRIKSTGRPGSVFTGKDIDFTIDGKPYEDVIGPCRSMDIHIGDADTITSIVLCVFPRESKEKKYEKESRR